MDWNAAVAKNTEVLKRIVATLVAMVGLSELGDNRSPIKATLPRHLRVTMLRLLRPTEAAVRRLIIVAARGLVVKLAPLRPPKPPIVPHDTQLRRLGIAVTLGPAQIAALAAAQRKAAALAAKRKAAPARLSFALFDPFPRLVLRRRRIVNLPRIGWDDRPPSRPPATRNDALDATRIVLRLRALGSALDDLPAQARRFARWRTRRDAGHGNRIQRVWPLRGGYPYGIRRPGSLRKKHEIDDILRDLDGLALWAMERRDTS